MTSKDGTSDSAATTVSVPAHSTQYVAHWRTAEERAQALKTKMRRRRAAHRIALRRSPANG